MPHLKCFLQALILPAVTTRFENPINNGQHADSTDADVKLMKRRTYVLHKELQGFVQRMNMSVLKDELPSKCVYVISVRLSAVQRELYTHYLQYHGILKDEDEAMEFKSQQLSLFHAYHAFSKV
jgi:transcriptional regulator ATRX